MLERGRSISPSLLFPPLCPICLVFLSFFLSIPPLPFPPSVHSFLVFSFIPLDIRVSIPSPFVLLLPSNPFLSFVRITSVSFFSFHTLSRSLFPPPSSTESSPDIIHPFSDSNPGRCIERFRVHWPRYSAPFDTNFSARREIFLPAFEIHRGKGKARSRLFRVEPCRIPIESEENYSPFSSPTFSWKTEKGIIFQDARPGRERNYVGRRKIFRICGKMMEKNDGSENSWLVRGIRSFNSG